MDSHGLDFWLNGVTNGVMNRVTNGVTMRQVLARDQKEPSGSQEC